MTFNTTRGRFVSVWGCIVLLLILVGYIDFARAENTVNFKGTILGSTCTVDLTSPAIANFGPVPSGSSGVANANGFKGPAITLGLQCTGSIGGGSTLPTLKITGKQDAAGLPSGNLQASKQFCFRDASISTSQNSCFMLRDTNGATQTVTVAGNVATVLYKIPGGTTTNVPASVTFYPWITNWVKPSGTGSATGGIVAVNLTMSLEWR